MLDVSRAEIESFLRDFQIPWAEDHTNLDTDRLRAALRHGPAKELSELRPGSVRRAARTASLMRDVVVLLESRATSVFGDAREWGRRTLAAEVDLVIAEGLRRAAIEMMGGRSVDRLTGAIMDDTIRAIRDTSGETRSFDWPGGVRVIVTRDAVRIVQD